MPKMPSLARRCILKKTLGTCSEEIVLHFSYYLYVLHNFSSTRSVCFFEKCAMLTLIVRKLMLPNEVFPTELVLV